MKYELNTWRNGTGQEHLSVPTAAGLLADGETLTVAAIPDGTGAGVVKGEPVPGMSLVLWTNPLVGEPGEPRFTMRWAGGSSMAPGSAETLAMHRVIARAGQIAALAESLRDAEDAEDEAPEEFDLARDLAFIAIAALRSPQGTSPAAAVAITRVRRELGIDGATPVDDVASVIRAALEASHADR